MCALFTTTGSCDVSANNTSSSLCPGQSIYPYTSSRRPGRAPVQVVPSQRYFFLGRPGPPQAILPPSPPFPIQEKE